MNENPEFSENRGIKNCIAIATLLAATLSISGNATAQQVVKKSTSGLCHCPGRLFYERTSNFKPFENLNACLASGGREPQQEQGNCPTEPPPSITSLEEYDRNAFGGWADADDDCLNTRHERLEARSLTTVETTTEGCRVVAGHWNDFYTGEIVSVSSELDIDHVVPLRWAWERGASLWEPEKRRQFANDPANLLPVSASANRSKGASGPLEWLPPDESFACEYVLRFSRVTDMYELQIPKEEATLLEQLTSEQCD